MSKSYLSDDDKSNKSPDITDCLIDDESSKKQSNRIKEEIIVKDSAKADNKEEANKKNLVSLFKLVIYRKF